MYVSVGFRGVRPQGDCMEVRAYIHFEQGIGEKMIYADVDSSRDPDSVNEVRSSVAPRDHHGAVDIDGRAPLCVRQIN